MKSTIVLKFGGASVADAKSFDNITNIIIHKKKIYQNIVVVVSAMGNTTDELLDLAHRVNPAPPRRELDMLISVGERMSISLLAMALAKKNIDAISFTGSQSGILTTHDHFDAKIVDLKPKRLSPCLEAGQVVIVAGFQGMSREGDITTLGRGGSDTTAVALAVALKAVKVEFFKDVLGIYNCDPKKNSNAQILSRLSYDEALTIVKNGAQVLQDRCILIAKKNRMPLHVLSFQQQDYFQNEGSLIGGEIFHLPRPEACYE